MTEDNVNLNAADEVSREEFKQLLEKDSIKIPQIGDTVIGVVLSASKAEVRLDINGILSGVVRGQELYEEAAEYSGLKPGDEVEATVIDAENENGELELSFRFAGQEKALQGLKNAFNNKTNIKVKVVDANKGGLLANFAQIAGFLPVSQLAPENYPRINGGDKGKILEKLRSFIGKEMEVKVINLDEKEDKIIFSEEEAWKEKQKDIISKYQVGTVVEGDITAVTDFGVFVTFGENLEGLIHISELAWQRIDDPSDLYKVGEKIKAEIINVDGSKIFLSAKKLMTDPWENVGEKYKIGQRVTGTVLKVNPFGLFIKLDNDIHGLGHISQLYLEPNQKITDIYQAGREEEFTIITIEPKDHRLGLAAVRKEKEEVKEKKKETEDEEVKDEKKKEKKTEKMKEEDKKEKKKEEEKKTEKKVKKDKEEKKEDKKKEKKK
jgi:small subunit ribosomal protein S1